MHIFISAKAKLDQLYQCTPLIVGDKYADCETMSFLGAKLTKDYLEPYGPSMYVLSATPLAVMDALQERGFELKICHTVEDYITWIMCKPSEKIEEAESSHNQQADPPEEPKIKWTVCEPKTKETSAPKNVSIRETKTEESNAPAPVQSHVHTQTAESQTEELHSVKSQTEKSKSDKSQTENSPTKKSKIDKQQQSTEKLSSSSSESDSEHGKIVVSKSSDASTLKTHESEEKTKRPVSSKKKKREPREPRTSETALRLTSEHSDIKSTRKHSTEGDVKDDSDDDIPTASQVILGFTHKPTSYT